MARRDEKSSMARREDMIGGNRRCNSPSLDRDQSKSRKRVTFCDEVIEHEPEPCDLSYDSMEDGEVGSQEEQQEKEEDVKEAFKEEIDDGDGDLEERDVEVRSSSPPA